MSFCSKYLKSEVYIMRCVGSFTSSLFKAASRRGFLRLSRVPPTSRVFTSGYVNTEIILHFFYKITNERGTKTVFTYAHVKWFYGQSERAYYLNYFINIYEKWFIDNVKICILQLWPFIGKLKIIHVHKTAVKGL